MALRCDVTEWIIEPECYHVVSVVTIYIVLYGSALCISLATYIKSIQVVVLSKATI